MNQAKSITQNTTYYTIALVIQKTMAFVYFTFIARILGVDQTGDYSTALSFTTLFAILIDIGLSSILTREGAKENQNIQKIFQNIISVKVPLSIITYLLVVLFAHLIYPTQIHFIIYLAGLMMILDSLSLTLWACFRAVRNLKYESMGVLLFEIVKFGGGIFVLSKGWGIKVLFIVLVLASLTQFSYSLYLNLKKLKLKIKFTFEKLYLKNLIKMSWPFFLAGVFIRVYSQVDTVLVSKISCPEIVDGFCRANVGWYAIAKKINDALLFIPMAFVAALYPAMSYYFAHNKERLKQSFEEASKYLVIISLPIAVGVIVLAPTIVTQIFTQAFSNSALPLKIMMIGITFMFLTYPIGSLLNACNKQHINTVNIGISSLCMVILNLILIPRLNFIGAAITLALGNFILFVLGLLWVPKIISYNKKYLVKNFLKSFSAALIMGLVIHYLNTYFYFIFLIILGAIIYITLLYLFKGFKLQDLINFKQAILKKS